EDICPRPESLPPQPTQPLVAPLYTAAVYRCESIEQADALLSGHLAGYAYLRDGHPNADLLSEKCRALHGAERAVICSSGMAALAVAALSQLAAGDHVVLSNQLYGRSLVLFTTECARLGIKSTVVDVCDLNAVRASLAAETKLIVAETIANPLLRVPDITALATLARSAGARLLVDNTFASPAVCRPLDHGADLVMESLTKIMSGHSDVCLGLLCGHEKHWTRVPAALSTFGFTASPFDCWMAGRGLGTMALRVDRASANALAAAHFLAGQSQVAAVYYPGLAAHPDHALAVRQFLGGFGSMVSFTLADGRAAADRFIQAARAIPFAPSLGDLSTTLSHPEVTSHRGMTPEARAALGITGGTIRLSLGIESTEAVLAALAEGLAGI
ncbi:MAG TPA: aminotransferase class I/II-fold pyridoxal phosphate-dependent enzyme, partial [Pirellulales bacterium]|nr:aminotransferase class I/II-fold pyridoxal phosphate-dependent enzyme [Pirellulales bacterium]